MESVDLNWGAIIVAALVPMVLGVLWYSPALFAEPWMRAVGRTREELTGAAFGYVLSAVAALLMSYTLARITRWAEVDDLWNGALVGLLAWVGLVATVLAVTTYFGGRPRALWVINAGYQLVALVVVGAIHGVWE
jgi:fumarate reductase subunit C